MKRLKEIVKNKVIVKAAIKREQNQACLSYAEREQARCETSIVNNILYPSCPNNTIYHNADSVKLI